MLKQVGKRLQSFSMGISLKLFLAFWLVIIASVVISYLVTMQFRHNPTQEQANPQQLTLLANYREKLDGKQKVKLKRLQHKFQQKHQQLLIVKRLSSDQVYAPRQRVWSKVKHYLKRHSLENPITVDFAFTQVTSSEPIMVNGQQIQLFVATTPERKKLMNILIQLPVALRLTLLLAFSFLCCWLLAKSFSKPLIAIQKASKDIGQGKLSTRINHYDKRSDEFGALARSFNQMAEQLESNISAHQRLLGDVSHELRSPLTRLQLAVALAEKNIGNTEEQQKHLTRCETEVDRLDDMIADVLTLSRLEHSNNAFCAESIDLKALTTQVISDCQYYANSKDVSINQRGPEHLYMLADSKLLASALSNVINNAIKYSPQHQKIEVLIEQQAQQVQLIITDQGQGVPEDMLAQLFTPFFRVADARDRNTGGIGLGLAITQQAIQLHQGKITAKNIKPQGLQVIISLPYPSAPLA